MKEKDRKILRKKGYRPMTQKEYEEKFISMIRGLALLKTFRGYAQKAKDKETEERLNQYMMSTMWRLSEYKKGGHYYGA